MQILKKPWVLYKEHDGRRGERVNVQVQKSNQIMTEEHWDKNECNELRWQSPGLGVGIKHAHAKLGSDKK